jgi:thymidylate synthase (FAD)
MRIGLISSTANIDRVVWAAARQCYMDGSAIGTEMDKPVLGKELDFILGVVESGHTSVLEHGCLTFAISGISRNCSHQLVRHRIASYSQQSQRRVKAGALPVVPVSVRAAGQEAVDDWERISKMMLDLSREFSEKHPEIHMEDTRMLLPHGMPTDLVMSINLRSFANFLNERMCAKAQAEICALAGMMRSAAASVSEIVAKSKLFGPKCLANGRCNERKPCPMRPLSTSRGQ